MICWAKKEDNRIFYEASVFTPPDFAFWGSAGSYIWICQWNGLESSAESQSNPVLKTTREKKKIGPIEKMGWPSACLVVCQLSYTIRHCFEHTEKRRRRRRTGLTSPFDRTAKMKIVVFKYRDDRTSGVQFLKFPKFKYGAITDILNLIHFFWHRCIPIRFPAEFKWLKSVSLRIPTT